MKRYSDLFPAAILLLAGLLGLGAGCIRNPVTHKINAHLLSYDAERKIGIASKAKILQEYDVIKSTQVTSYVNRVGQRLAQVCDRPTVDYDFTVLDSDLINAFAVPGGFVFITRGLLETIDNEAELAMVLGHEIGHVAAMHGVQMIQKEMGQNALTILGTIGAAVAAGPEAMLMVANTADLFSSLYLLGYSRDNERQADNLGLQYMMRAGYDPQAALTFLKKLGASDEDSKGWDLYFRTHPSTKERIEIIESMIGQGQKDARKSHEQDYQKIKALLPKVDQAERGKITGNSYLNQVHQLVLKVPANWSLGYYLPEALISFQTTDREGEGRLQVIELSSMTMTAEDLASRFSKYSGFQLVNGRQVLYNAGYGYMGRFLGVSPTGKLLDMRLFATIRYGKGFILLCGAPPEKADSYLLDFEQILRSFRFV